MKYSRYEDLYQRFIQKNPERVIEIGVWKGDRAVRFLESGTRLREYVGFDLFEEMTPDFHVQEGMADCFAVSHEQVHYRLIQTARVDECIRIIKGNTRDTLPTFVSKKNTLYDFIFIDGGHSLDTIESDWRYAKQLLAPNGVCVFDDYYLDDDTIGCKALVDRLDPMFWEKDFFRGIEKTIHGHYVTMVAVHRRPSPEVSSQIKSLRVRFIGGMPSKGYSGGRLLALTLAEALATTGADVEFLVNNVPEMYREFQAFSKVRLTKTDFQRLSDVVDPAVDILIIIPGQGNIPLHGEFVRHGIECHAKITLLNFESPNWFNVVSPFKRDVGLWKGWDIISDYSSLVLSISAEGDKWARDYYTNVLPNCQFEYCYPAINTPLADAAPVLVPRNKQIVMLTRVDPHKGFDTLEPLVTSDFAGYTVTVHIGNGQFPFSAVDAWQKKFTKVGIKFEVRGSIIGLDKFTMLKSASLLYFPTRFEGFGIPPLEAAYCLLPTVCSDLPVLREFGQNAFFYADPTDPEDIRRAAREALVSHEKVLSEHSRITRIARMEECGKRLAGIFEKII